MTKIQSIFKVLFVLFVSASAVSVLAVAIDDSITPQNCDRNNPTCAKFVDTTSVGQIKWGAFIAGGLRSLTNMFVDGKLGVGTLRPSTGEQILKADIEGAVGARFYCDQDGNHCVAGDSLNQGGSGSISITTNNGGGLIFNPTTITNTGTINLDTTVIQKRIIGACDGSSAIKLVNADGTVVCQATGSGSGSINLTQGTGITLTPNPITSAGSISADFNSVQHRLTASCPAGKAVQGIDVNGQATCVATTGTGVSLPIGTNNKTLRHDGSNWVSSYLLRNNETKVTIGMDPAGLSDAHKFGVNGNVFVQGVVTMTGGNPSAGKVWTSSDSYGNGSWQAVTSSSINLLAGTGIILTPNPITSAGTIRADFNSVQHRLTASCPAGQSIQGIDVNGIATCTAVGGATNWTLIGNNLSPKTLTNNVGIGTANPTTKLEVNGTFKLTDGTQGANKVLTSNASGQASWQAPVSFASCKQYKCTGGVNANGDTTVGGGTERLCYQVDSDLAYAPVSNNMFTYERHSSKNSDSWSRGVMTCPNQQVLTSATAVCMKAGKNERLTFKKAGGVVSMIGPATTAVCDTYGYLPMAVLTTCCPS